jgi:glycerol-3-phosphate O-acyltransferase
MESNESLDESACVERALKFGRQAYLQRRISSESSIGKLLFKNAYKMLESRNLTNYSDPNVAENRMELARELRDLLRRLELIRAIGVASRGATQEK